MATTLVHMAFWDDYCYALLLGCEQGAPVTDLTNFDAVNAGIIHMASAIPEGSAARLVLTSAEAVDRHVEQLEAGLVTEIVESGHAHLLRRAMHRGVHLDQIVQALDD